jgi:hypothetical protein
LGRVILQEVSQIVRRHNIAHRHHIEFLLQALLQERPKHQTSDTAETIDRDFHCHNSLFFVNIVYPKLFLAGALTPAMHVTKITTVPTCLKGQ